MHAVDAPQVFIDFTHVDMPCPQAMKDFIQGAVVVPRVEQIPDGSPFAELLGQIAPRGAGAEYPQDAVDHHAAANRRSPRMSRRRKDIANQIPLIVGKSVACHRNSFRAKRKQVSLHLAKSDANCQIGVF
jgi:hypothetical protein